MLSNLLYGAANSHTRIILILKDIELSARHFFLAALVASPWLCLSGRRRIVSWRFRLIGWWRFFLASYCASVRSVSELQRRWRAALLVSRCDRVPSTSTNRCKLQIQHNESQMISKSKWRRSDRNNADKEPTQHLNLLTPPRLHEKKASLFPETCDIPTDATDRGAYDDAIRIDRTIFLRMLQLV